MVASSICWKSDARPRVGDWVLVELGDVPNERVARRRRVEQAERVRASLGST
jgi:hypothetical protein